MVSGRACWSLIPWPKQGHDNHRHEPDQSVQACQDWGDVVVEEEGYQRNQCAPNQYVADPIAKTNHGCFLPLLANYAAKLKYYTKV